MMPGYGCSRSRGTGAQHPWNAQRLAHCSRFQSRRHSQRPPPSAMRNMRPTRPQSGRRSRPRRTSSPPAVRGQRPFQPPPRLSWLLPRQRPPLLHLLLLRSLLDRRALLPERDSSRPMHKRGPVAPRIPLFGSTRSRTSTTSQDIAITATRSRVLTCARGKRRPRATGLRRMRNTHEATYPLASPTPGGL
jgi:hypothetical protein